MNQRHNCTQKAANGGDGCDEEKTTRAEEEEATAAVAAESATSRWNGGPSSLLDRDKSPPFPFTTFDLHPPFVWTDVWYGVVCGVQKGVSPMSQRPIHHSQIAPGHGQLPRANRGHLRRAPHKNAKWLSLREESLLPSRPVFSTSISGCDFSPLNLETNQLHIEFRGGKRKVLVSKQIKNHEAWSEAILSYQKNASNDA